MSYRRTLETDRRHLMEDFQYVHMARKVVGVGSVGTRAWILLMLGRDDQDPLFLQAKEAQESVLEWFVQRPLLLVQGVSPRVVMEVLGHSQLSITMDLNSHVMPSALRDAADAMDRALNGGR